VFAHLCIYVSCAIYLLVLAILSDIQYELQVKQKILIFLVQIYNCDVCMLHYFLRISHSMEELGDQCNVVFAGLLYRINLEIAGERVEGRGNSPLTYTY
jgi:hypothetical protein